MDALVDAALAKVNEAVGAIPWDEVEGLKSGGLVHTAIRDRITQRVGTAIHAVDALKSALKAVWPK